MSDCRRDLLRFNLTQLWQCCCNMLLFFFSFQRLLVELTFYRIFPFLRFLKAITRNFVQFPIICSTLCFQLDIIFAILVDALGSDLSLFSRNFISMGLLFQYAISTDTSRSFDNLIRNLHLIFAYRLIILRLQKWQMSFPLQINIIFRYLYIWDQICSFTCH